MRQGRQERGEGEEVEFLRWGAGQGVEMGEEEGEEPGQCGLRWVLSRRLTVCDGGGNCGGEQIRRREHEACEDGEVGGFDHDVKRGLGAVWARALVCDVGGVEG